MARRRTRLVRAPLPMHIKPPLSFRHDLLFTHTKTPFPRSHYTDIAQLELALKEAEAVKLHEFRMPNDPQYGAKVIERAVEKLKQAKQAQKGIFVPVSKSKGVPPSGEGEADFDPQARMFEEEITAARAKDDKNLVKMLTLAKYGQLDSYKVDVKLCDKQGNVTDKVRACGLSLFLICTHPHNAFNLHTWHCNIHSDSCCVLSVHYRCAAST